jgi:hypothetical protein
MGATAHEQITATLRTAAGALHAAEVPFMLGGSMGCWARGGPQSQNDLDLMLPAEEAERALAVLADAGMRPERPPEAWLLKAFDGEVMVDLIHESLGVGPITHAMVEEAERLPVLAIEMPVMSLEDILAGKLLAISEQRLDYGPPLEIARALRERIGWAELALRTEASPYARAFFALLRELGVVPAQPVGGAAPGQRERTLLG